MSRSQPPVCPSLAWFLSCCSPMAPCRHWSCCLLPSLAFTPPGGFPTSLMGQQHAFMGGTTHTFVVLPIPPLPRSVMPLGALFGEAPGLLESLPHCTLLCPTTLHLPHWPKVLVPLPCQPPRHFLGLCPQPQLPMLASQHVASPRWHSSTPGVRFSRTTSSCFPSCLFSGSLLLLTLPSLTLGLRAQATSEQAYLRRLLRHAILAAACHLPYSEYQGVSGSVLSLPFTMGFNCIQNHRSLLIVQVTPM